MNNDSENMETGKSILSLKDIQGMLKISFIKSRTKILLVNLLVLFLYILSYFLQPIEFESGATVYVDQANTQTGLAGGLIPGFLGGETRGSGQSLFGPEMYQEIVGSQTFLLQLIQQKIYLDTGKNKYTTLADYYKDGEKHNFKEMLFDLPGTFNKMMHGQTIHERFKFDSLDRVTNQNSAEIEIPYVRDIDPEKMNIINILRKRIHLDLTGKSLRITVYTADPVISSYICQQVLTSLLEYVKRIKTQKQLSNLKFLMGRKVEAEAAYNQSINALAHFRDNSLGLIYQSVQSREQVLLNELNLNYNIYSSFSLKVTDSEVELKKETPIFSVLDPINIPKVKKGPYFLKYLIESILSQLLFSISIVALYFIRNNYKSFNFFNQ